MRAANIPHAEYEILKGLCTTNFDKLDIDFYSLCGGDPFGDGNGNYEDEHARNRFAKAIRNIRGIIINKLATRLKYLPKDHTDYGLTLEELKEELKE